MKKVLLILMTMTGGLTIQADTTYPYMTFETTDGGRVSVSVASLQLTISGTTLTAGSESFTLTNLSKMYFSAADETTGIELITNTELDEVTDIYDLQGHKVSKSEMKKGVYIVKTKDRTHKIVVR